MALVHGATRVLDIPTLVCTAPNNADAEVHLSLHAGAWVHLGGPHVDMDGGGNGHPGGYHFTNTQIGMTLTLHKSDSLYAIGTNIEVLCWLMTY